MTARFFANFFSVIFHPLLLPTYCLLAVMAAAPFEFGQLESKARILMIVQIFALTFAFPLLAVVIMYALELVKSLKLQERHDRILFGLRVVVRAARTAAHR